MFNAGTSWNRIHKCKACPGSFEQLMKALKKEGMLHLFAPLRRRPTSKLNERYGFASSAKLLRQNSRCELSRISVDSS